MVKNSECMAVCMTAPGRMSRRLRSVKSRSLDAFRKFEIFVEALQITPNEFW